MSTPQYTFAIRNLWDFQRARAIRTSGSQNVHPGQLRLNFLPEVHDYLEAHPPSADASLDPLTREDLQYLRHIIETFKASRAPRTEPLRVIPGDEPGVFTTNYPINNFEEMRAIGSAFSQQTPPGSQIDLWLEPGFEAELRSHEPANEILDGSLAKHCEMPRNFDL
ncbi:hypothetical protein HYFRA_00002109 [Hymenoscyphus fraxineus]|uniref:Uncharacterized protein n=1 Tax=Hymenoscyphus fraxineus TaxID=746836 RepID=A0A9N9PJS2_9HELO|nr:hypothetical protein HYFRA_00002109 [Hymenoscyphus fraxineus]